MAFKGSPSSQREVEVTFKGSPSSQHQHCTDEAQKAETVLSAVSYIYIYIIQMKVSRGTRIVLDNEGAVTIEYVVKLLCF